MTLLYILILYVAFRAKHLICDFFLQTGWMALSKEASHTKEGLKALAAHAGIHAAFTFMLVVIFAPKLWWLGIVDFVVHGAIDRYKAAVVYKNNWGYKDHEYWWALGVDQEAHNFTHLAYIVMIVLSWDIPSVIPQ